MSATVVTPRGFKGRSNSLHPKGPLFAIRCGGCPATFQTRVPRIDKPTLRCPECGAFNEMPLRMRSA